MVDRAIVLRQVMQETGTTQRELSRISGVHQPSISQALSGRIEISDDQLSRLLSCMGFELEVVRSARPAPLTRAERRSWLLHRQLAVALDEDTFERWRPIMRTNIARLRGGVQGQPHERNVRRWATLVRTRDLTGVRRAMTGLDRDMIEMREVSPLGGLLADDDRQAVLSSGTR